MELQEFQRSFCHVESVVEVAVALTDLTKTTDRCSEIPLFLAKVFKVRSVTLGVLRLAQDDSKPAFLMYGSSWSVEGESESPEDKQAILDAYYHLSSLAGPFRCMELPEVAAENCQSGTDVPGAPGMTAFVDLIDDQHGLVLKVSQGELGDLTLDAVDSLRLVVRELSKQLYCLFAWNRRRSVLGDPFNRLTEREWVVLQSLTCDASEKELAIRLGMRPHSLHSRIKSIYEKLQVQGRLALIQKFNSAVSQFRIQMHQSNSGLRPRESESSFHFTNGSLKAGQVDTLNC